MQSLGKELVFYLTGRHVNLPELSSSSRDWNEEERNSQAEPGVRAIRSCNQSLFPFKCSVSSKSLSERSINSWACPFKRREAVWQKWLSNAPGILKKPKILSFLSSKRKYCLPIYEVCRWNQSCAISFQVAWGLWLLKMSLVLSIAQNSWHLLSNEMRAHSGPLTKYHTSFRTH